MCPRLLTSSLGPVKSGVAKKGDGVKADGIRGSSSCVRKVNGLGGLENRTVFWALLSCGVGRGVFFLRAPDRLKEGVVDGINELLVGVRGVLVPPGPPGRGAVPLRWLGVVSSLGDGVRYVLPDNVVRGAGVGWSREAGKLVSSGRLVVEMELLEFLLRLA